MPKCPYCNNTVDVELTKSLSAEDIQDMISAIDESSLAGTSLEFITELKARLLKHKDRTKVTIPQRRWLTDLRRSHPAKRPEGKPVITDDDVPF